MSEAAQLEVTEFEDWLGEDIELEVPESPLDPAEYDEFVDRRLARIREIRAEIERNDEAARRRIKMVEQWQAEENTPLHKKIEWIEAMLLGVIPSFPFPKGKKSRRLPSGKIGIRTVTTSDKLEILDEPTVIEFAEQTDGLREQIRKSIGLKPLKDYYKATGEVPPGTDVIEGKSEDRPFIDTESE